MKTQFQKTVMSLILVGTMVTQTGCVSGLFGWATGTALATWACANGLMNIHSAKVSRSELPMFLGCALGGAALTVVLDEKNPGRAEALNALPIDQSTANQLHTDLQTLEKYNEALPRILEVNGKLERLLAAKVPDLDAMAQAVGQPNGLALVKLVSADSLSRGDIEKFAEKQGLETDTAALYLHLRFDAKTGAL